LEGNLKDEINYLVGPKIKKPDLFLRRKGLIIGWIKREKKGKKTARMVQNSD